MSDGNDIVYWWDGTHWTHGAAPVPDAPGPPVPGGVVYCGPNTWYMTAAGKEGFVLTSHNESTPTWEPLVAVNIPDISWTAPTLLNGWSNYASTWDSAGFSKVATKMLELKGLVKGGLLGQPIFILPEGSRPAKSSPHLTVGGLGIARIDVSPDGVVKVRSYQNSGTNSYVSLSDIRVTLP